MTEVVAVAAVGLCDLGADTSCRSQAGVASAARASGERSAGQRWRVPCSNLAGRHQIVYLGEAQQGGRALYLRALGGLEPQRIPGTELPSDFENANPFFSWDGQSIGFRSPGKGILRVALAGGPSGKIRR